jgi:hypothetical protein
VGGRCLFQVPFLQQLFQFLFVIAWLFCKQVNQVQGNEGEKAPGIFDSAVQDDAGQKADKQRMGDSRFFLLLGCLQQFLVGKFGKVFLGHGYNCDEYKDRVFMACLQRAGIVDGGEFYIRPP